MAYDMFGIIYWMYLSDMKEIIDNLTTALEFHEAGLEDSINEMHHHQAQIDMYKEAILKLMLKDEE